MTTAVLIFAVLVLAVSGGALAARLASRPAKGRHHPAPAPVTGRACHGPGHLGVAGRLSTDTELLAPAASNPPGAEPWDFDTQMHPPAIPCTDDDPLNTGELAAVQLARGDITPAQEADRLAARHFGNPEMIP